MNKRLENLKDMPTTVIEDYIDDRHEILPDLWIGSHPSGYSLNIKYVLSLNGARPFCLDGQRIISTYFEDGPLLPDPSYLYSLADMATLLWKDGPLLVHCAMGLNRSALIIGLMLVRNDLMTADEAIFLMRAKRSSRVLYNTTFEAWLRSHDNITGSDVFSSEKNPKYYLPDTKLYRNDNDR